MGSGQLRVQHSDWASALKFAALVDQSVPGSARYFRMTGLAARIDWVSASADLSHIEDWAAAEGCVVEISRVVVVHRWPAQQPVRLLDVEVPLAVVPVFGPYCPLPKMDQRMTDLEGA